ncbi:MAG: BTAD domain-containing putative transcriptional regulator, partial [Actinomycetota bacterium]
MEQRVVVVVLGPVGARVDGRLLDLGGRRQRRLLAALAIEPIAVGADRLADRVWGDGALPEDPRRTLRTYIARLRQALGDTESILTLDSGWRLNPELVVVDTEQLRDCVDRASAPGLDAHGRLAAVDAALELYAGQPFGDLADEDWVRGEAERLTQLQTTLIERRYQAMLDAGRHTEAVPELAAEVEANPLRDRLVGLQMLALHRSGRQAEALRAFQAHRSRLADELGLEPGAELVELERRILADDASLLLTDSPGRALRSYRLGEQLGEGAFAMVYRGTQPSLGREVAVKIIRSELANRPEFIRRFEAEAHLVARLEHPRIVPLYDYWREPDRAFLVFRYLRGGTLEAQLTRSGPLPLDDAIRMIDHVGGGLTAAHEAGVIHRDVKPANVFCDEAGNYYLGDFGIALEASELSDPTAALSAGSPAYAAP